MSSQIEISNMALFHLGQGTKIASIDERSAAAQACKTFFEMVRDLVLQDMAWPFATKFAELALVEEDPTTEWSFSYRYPNDCLTFRRILSGVRTDNRESRVSYIEGQDSEGTLIYTDMANAVGEYTGKITDVSRFSPQFAIAMSYRLAFYIAAPLTSGDPSGLAGRVMNHYAIHITKAQATALNEIQPDEEPEAGSIRARG